MSVAAQPVMSVLRFGWSVEMVALYTERNLHLHEKNMQGAKARRDVDAISDASPM